VFTTKSNLYRHQRTKHTTVVHEEEEEVKKPSFECILCGLVCYGHTVFQAHVIACRGDGPARAPRQVLMGDQRVVHVEEVESVCADFLKWLGEPAVTSVEESIKKTLLREPKQLQPIVHNLRFLFESALPDLDPEELHLRQLIQAPVAEPLLAALKERVKAERVYQLALLLKKVCIYICVRHSEATRLFTSPATMSGWTTIVGYCYDSGRKRKLRQRDRMVLEVPAEAMTPEELATVTKGCFARLADLEAKWGLAPDCHRHYSNYFLLFIVMLLAPRSQTLRELSTDTLVAPASPGDPYIVRISAEHSKVDQPVLLVVPTAVTPQLEFYLKNVLGWPSYKGPLFLQRGGAPRKDYTAVVKIVTEELLGKAVTAHPLRGAVATTFHEHQESSDTMMRSLAQSMNHSTAVQQSHYVYQNRIKAQHGLHRVLLDATVGPEDM
jgi:hypothetical protein